jgi:hypothetical protein
MKSHSLLIKLVVCCGFGLMHSPLYAQGRTLTAAQLDTVVKTDIDLCSLQSGGLKSGLTNAAAVIPTSNAKAFPKDRIAKTLNGVWRGRVIGDDGEVGVDYFWINDMKRSEGLIIAQRSNKVTLQAATAAASAPKFSYLMCAHEEYVPSKATPQVHEFVKVSDNIDDAPSILEKATGLKLNMKGRPTLSDLWQGLVKEKYFSDPRFADEHGIAYAGGLFKPMEIQPVASAIGPALLSLKWEAEYRGGGATSLKFTNDVPVLGVEYAQFVGTTTPSGDFLVSSPGNGRLWKVEATKGGKYDLAFDKVVIGPLAR